MRPRYSLPFLLLASIFASIPSFAQHQRIVLIEEFTSATCQPCVRATEVMNETIRANPARLVSIRYHLNIPLPNDPMYLANTADNSARKTYYNVSGIPAAFVGGDLPVNPGNSSEMADRVAQSLARDGGTSPVNIVVTQEVDATDPMKRNMSVEVTSSESLNGLRLLVAAVESKVHDESTQNLPGNNGEREFYDVMRKMLPNAEGTVLDQGAGTTRTYTFSYTIANNWVPAEMYTVAFIQDPFDDVVWQAGFSPKPPSAAVRDDVAAGGTALFGITPNASQGVVEVEYTTARATDVVLTLVDARGALVARYDEGMMPAGEHRRTLDLQAAPSGVYTLVIDAGGARDARSLVIAR